MIMAWALPMMVGKTWYHPDEKPLAQFYAVDVDMAYPYNVYGGLQDNGSVKDLVP